MISEADVRKLREERASGAPVLSIYLWVPVDLDQLRGLPARADDLLALAVNGEGRPAVRALEAERRFVRERLEVRGREWMGHTVAIFASEAAGLREEFALPVKLPDRAVVADRPHVRPLLVAMQRCPEYLAAVVDRQHAWIFHVAGTRIESVAEPVTPGERSHGFSGWYGLESYRINERITGLARHHYRETGAILAQALRDNEQPLVVGGHMGGIPPFLAAIPDEVRERLAGRFVIDPHTMTPARVRELSAPVLEDWVARQERRLVEQITQWQPDGLTAIGLNSCLDAANQHAAQLLVVPVGGMIPGFACEQCGALACTSATCVHGPSAARPAPDLLEELANATLDDGGEVAAADNPPGDAVARLRFPLVQEMAPAGLPVPVLRLTLVVSGQLRPCLRPGRIATWEGGGSWNKLNADGSRRSTGARGRSPLSGPRRTRPSLAIRSRTTCTNRGSGYCR